MAVKKTKTRDRIKSLSREESNRIGEEVEQLLKGEMKSVADSYIRNYRNSVRNTFGWTPEDLKQEIRLKMFKGLATFDPDLGYKKTTYVSNILQNFFKNITPNRVVQLVVSELCVNLAYTGIDTSLV